jgi:hypothetical protein
MPYVSTTQFGVTATTMRTNYMVWLKSSDTAVLENAIDVVSADVCRMLWSIGIEPVSLTQAHFPDDWMNVHNLVSIGTLGQYSMATASNREQARDWIAEYKRRLQEVRENPSEYLQAYQQADGVNSVRTHTESMSSSELQASRGLFWNPLNRINSWTR